MSKVWEKDSDDINKDYEDLVAAFERGDISQWVQLHPEYGLRPTTVSKEEYLHNQEEQSTEKKYTFVFFEIYGHNKLALVRKYEEGILKGNVEPPDYEDVDSYEFLQSNKTTEEGYVSDVLARMSYVELANMEFALDTKGIWVNKEVEDYLKKQKERELAHPSLSKRVKLALFKFIVGPLP